MLRLTLHAYILCVPQGGAFTGIPLCLRELCVGETEGKSSRSM